MRAIRSNAQLCSGMFHRIAFRVAVAHHHHRTVFGIECLSQARRFGIRSHNLAGVGVVSGHHHESVTVFLRELQRLLHRFVKIDGFANLSARIGRVILFIDRRPFHLQEETFLAFA
ncbi:hypothetical protein D3C76_1164870 [compost metagenome]